MSDINIRLGYGSIILGRDEKIITLEAPEGKVSFYLAVIEDLISLLEKHYPSKKWPQY